VERQAEPGTPSRALARPLTRAPPEGSVEYGICHRMYVYVERVSEFVQRFFKVSRASIADSASTSSFLTVDKLRPPCWPQYCLLECAALVQPL